MSISNNTTIKLKPYWREKQSEKELESIKDINRQTASRYDQDLAWQRVNKRLRTDTIGGLSPMFIVDIALDGDRGLVLEHFFTYLSCHLLWCFFNIVQFYLHMGRSTILTNIVKLGS